MRTSAVPANVTTLEDTIASGLNLTQVILLILPVFFSAVIFAALPPFMHIQVYKLAIITLFSAPLIILSIRVHGSLLLKWVILLAAYKFRPRLYLLSVTKGSCFCEHGHQEPEQYLPEIKKSPKDTVKFSELEPHQLSALDMILCHKRVLYKANKKGQLYALIENK